MILFLFSHPEFHSEFCHCKTQAKKLFMYGPHVVNQQKPHWLVGCNKGNNGLQNETKADHGSSQPPYVHTLELSTCGPSKLQSMNLFWFHLSHQPNTAVTAKVDQVWLPWASMGMMPEGQKARRPGLVSISYQVVLQPYTQVSKRVPPHCSPLCPT